MKKVALVTGSEGGIGSAISTQLVKDGFRVVACYFTGNYDCSIQWFNENGFTQDDVRLLEIDVSKPDECEKKLSALLGEEGHVDVVINGAGITKDSVFKKMTSQQWYDVINTNLNSIFNVTHPFFQSMCENGFGRIVNISSVNGLKGQFGQANYAAAKAGMIGFTKSLALEGAKNGVTANIVAPGYTATPMVESMRDDIVESIKAQIPMKRLAKPEEIASAVAFLVSDSGAYITGETLSVNGGLYMQ